ncbi:MAG: molybdopterin-synthase adenylyltransferase MoeB [Nitrospirota bacterium]
MALTDKQITKYNRHILLPEIGAEGQEKLLRARVLLIGVGGLGSAAGYYLAAAGIGTIGIVDHDQVELSNLQRQIIHSRHRIGLNKANSAKETLQALNDDVIIVPFRERIAAHNVRAIMRDFDVVVDASDNFSTRYLLNDACVLFGKKLVSAAVFRFEGQIMVISPHEGPCYRCVFESPPPPDMVQPGSTTGILGVVPGVLGTMQATEVIKIVLEIGHPLSGSLVKWNALDMQFRVIPIRKNPDCALCGDHRTITALIDYDRLCGVHAG